MKILWSIRTAASYVLDTLKLLKYVERVRELADPKGYQYSYLREVTTRKKVLMTILRLHLKSGDNFLDIMCGYSPLAEPLLKSGYGLTGFDANSHVINELRKNYPKGNWYQSSFNDEIQLTGFSVFLLLGTPDDLCCEPCFQEFLLNLLALNNPRLFFLEANKMYAKTPTKEIPFVDSALTRDLRMLRSYNCVLRLLIEAGYEVVEVGEYNAGLGPDWASMRIYSILKHKVAEL